MNALTDPFKQLVERRLWPVALLLVAALVAVPILLAKEPEKTSLPTPVAAAAPADTSEAVVSLDDPARRDEVRAVLGARKDPFRPAQLHAIPKLEDSLGGESITPSSGGGSTAPSDSSSASTGGGSPTTTTTTPDPVATSDPVGPDPVVTPTPEPKPTFELHSLQVRFGDIKTGDLTTRTVKRLTGLPGGNPAALYLGLSENHESAVFLVDAGVNVVGDGQCKPTGKDCQTLIMEPGETVFLTRGEHQWELDLIAIHTSKTTDAAAARDSRTEVAKGGRTALRRMSANTRFRYSEALGAVREIAPAQRSWKSVSTGFTSEG
jgi:hypothetical protein